MIFAEHVKAQLLSLINEMASFPWLFAQNPTSDFSRKRKLDFETMMRCIISMESGSLQKELLDFFEFQSETPSASAFNQQRDIIVIISLLLFFVMLIQLNYSK